MYHNVISGADFAAQPCGPRLDHGVPTVRYGIECSTNYLKVKNSFRRRQWHSKQCASALRDQSSFQSYKSDVLTEMWCGGLCGPQLASWVRGCVGIYTTITPLAAFTCLQPLPQFCRAHLIILPTHSCWLKSGAQKTCASSVIPSQHGSGAWFEIPRAHLGAYRRTDRRPFGSQTS